MSTEQKIHLMYGCTKDDLDRLIAEADDPQTHPTPVSYTHLTLPTIYSV